MTITQITPTKRNAHRYAIDVDGTYAFALSDEAVAQHHLQVGAKVTQEQIDAWVMDDQCRKAVDKACALLGYRARSCGELRQKLREKDYPDEAIDYAVNFLLERGYLDDQAFAAEYSRSLFDRGYGAKAVRFKLREKRVNDQIIDRVIREWAPEDMLEKAMAYGQKVWQKQAAETDAYKRKRRFFDSLYRRGFSYDLAKAVFSRLNEGEEHEDYS